MFETLIGDEHQVYELNYLDDQLVLGIKGTLSAVELERRWNEKLEEIDSIKKRLSILQAERYSLSSEEEARIRFVGRNFAEVWQSDSCPPMLKKKIFRTAIEEIVVRVGAEKETLQFTIHWKGGVHTQLEMALF